MTSTLFIYYTCIVRATGVIITYIQSQCTLAGAFPVWQPIHILLMRVHNYIEEHTNIARTVIMSSGITPAKYIRPLGWSYYYQLHI